MKMGDIYTEKRSISPKDSAYRRSNKPFMEKKRRARINNCLGQLKTLVLQAMRKDTNQYSKLEKADILEMTVKHLRQLQRHHLTQALSHDPTIANKYKAGFNECATEVVRYLSSLPGIHEEARERLINHLGNVVTSVNYQPRDTIQCSQPINVQIPHHINQGVPTVPSGCLLMPAGSQTPAINLQSNHSAFTQNLRHSPSTSPELRDNRENNQVCGSFQIVPNSSSPGAVAVYLGQSEVARQSADTYKQAIPLYSTGSQSRTKASVKAYDQSTFQGVSNSRMENSYNRVPSLSEQCIQDSLEIQLYDISVGCGRTTSPLKDDDVWRPW